MLNALKKLWTGLFLAVLHFPVAVAVSGLVGAQTGLMFWVMGIAAHQPMLSALSLSFRRRLAIWLTAMTVGGITAGLGAIALSLVMQTAADYALSASGRVTNAFWFVVIIRLVIRWAPVIVAWVVSGMLVSRSSRRREGASPSPTTKSARVWPAASWQRLSIKLRRATELFVEGRPLLLGPKTMLLTLVFTTEPSRKTTTTSSLS